MDLELAEHVRRVIDSNSYMALGTTDEAGHPWVSPVWFASEGYDSFHWVSSPEAKHSQNLAPAPISRSPSSTRRSRSAVPRPFT